MLMHMNTVNALAIRKSLGRILKNMEKDAEPVVVTRDRKPVAALIPYEVFKSRFVDVISADEIRRLKDQIKRVQSPSHGEDSLSLLRRLRDGERL
jgi:PHD/YefM family antitoxin component YafN of YafNO toxin-antitoxin module